MSKKSVSRKEDSRRKRKLEQGERESLYGESSHKISRQENSSISNIINFVLGSRSEMSDEISNMLLNCACKKLHKIIETAAKQMISYERNKLSADDFNLGLKLVTGANSLQDIGPLPGERRKVNINRGKLLQTIPQLPEARRGVEGVEAEVNLISNLLNKNVVKESVSSTQKFRIFEEWLNNDSPFVKYVSELPVELYTYYNTITKALLSTTKELYLTALSDLKTNPNILNLVPYFVSFLCTGIDKMHSCYPSVAVCLKALHSLISNQHFECDTYFRTMTNSLLMCLLDPSPNDKFNLANWSVRETAANVLAEILKRCRSKNLFYEILSHLESAYSNMESLICHYGAIITASSVGVTAITLTLLKHIDKYIEHLDLLETGDLKIRQASYIIQDKLIHLYYILICHFLKYECKDFPGYDKFPELSILYHYPLEFYKNIETFPIVLKMPFVEHFGDALVPYYPLLNFVSYNLHIRQKNKLKVTIRKPKFADRLVRSQSDVRNVDISFQECNQCGGIQKTVKGGKRHKKSVKCKKSVKHSIFKSIHKDPVELYKVFDVVHLKKHTIKIGEIKNSFILPFETPSSVTV